MIAYHIVFYKVLYQKKHTRNCKIYFVKILQTTVKTQICQEDLFYVLCNVLSNFMNVMGF